MKPVHPHVHGELLVDPERPVDRLGSSPRAWGTPEQAEESTREGRFIPTCMGNSDRHAAVPCNVTVHPHVHGELLITSRSGVSGIGSSPRAWGTQGSFRSDVLASRFIPTCMGNSLRSTTPASRRSVHPHVHGELPGKQGNQNATPGSSPRAWGTPAPYRPTPDLIRFIPTCMGNSRRSSPRPVPGSVHPHVHGELAISDGPEGGHLGSSPRAWGTLRGKLGDERRYRFIPTCMGNSAEVAVPPEPDSVHPHVHGELPTSFQWSPSMIGSSPRAWGTHNYENGIARFYRFIPTCMGNSRI